MALGSHPPIQGKHPTSGVEFVPPGQAVRHLGVLLTTGDRAAAAATMWEQLVGKVAARLQHWRAVELSYWGRVHVAKQVLAAAVVHVATFVEPPAQPLKALQRLIDGFAVHGGAAADADRPLRARPPAAAAALPRDEGGAAAVFFFF